MRFHSLVSFKKPAAAPATLGFSMIELLVSVGIVVLVLTITLTRQSSFNSAVLLRGEAFDLALAIRETQLSAVSSVGDSSGQFRSTLGVYFNTANPNEYILFRDSATGADDNNAYDSGEAYGTLGSIDPRFEIGAIDVGGSQSEVSVVFNRPNFDALFYNSSANLIDEPAARIELRVKGTTGGNCGDQWRIIEITRAGQIAVENCP